jgi:hypothetical protein
MDLDRADQEDPNTAKFKISGCQILWVCIAIYFRTRNISCEAPLKYIVYKVLIAIIFLG